MKAVWRLEGVAQHYDWGGRDFIANLVGKEPVNVIAEWWLGAHPKAPSRVLVDGTYQTLDAVIEHAPQAWLGESVAHNFGSLPFLLKVLDVEKMLSIQVHPDRIQAQAGFAREMEEAPAQRNYQDANHKPEMLFALSTCYLLHGFREVSDICAHLKHYLPFGDLITDLEEKGLRYAYEKALRLSHQEISMRFQAVSSLIRAYPKWTKDTPEYWILRALDERGDYGDCGLLGFFFLNLRVLQAGQTLYQPARLPHAYLYGRNIEIMANSDNVLRAGLTAKHVDVEELLAVLDYTPVTPLPCVPVQNGVHRRYYPLPCPDFVLEVFSFEDAGTMQLASQGPQIIFVLQGAVHFSEGCSETFSSGQSAFVAPSAFVPFSAVPGTQFFCARMGNLLSNSV